jgi:hypothetical protein
VAVHKFGENAFSKAYTFCIYVLHISWASVVGNGEAVHVGCGAVWAAQVGTYN